MLKIILFVILIYIAYILFFGKKRDKKYDKNTFEEELMVECTTCKTFIGISEAIKKDGQYFCSQKCAKVKK
ncbi:MAG: Prokaryotic metallothionein [Campylobacteraceae bacterium]|nr:Prokaryotic metallothionein [Campylobacteraceae bacterium]